MQTVHLWSKPCQAYHDVSKQADSKNSALAASEKLVRDQIASQPNDNAQPADLFRLLDANSERMIDFDHLKEFAKPRLLVASKVPGLG